MDRVEALFKVHSESLRKKHTRLNFELFMIVKYCAQFDKRKNTCTHTVKLRDASDAFMQGLYCFNKVN